MRLPHAVLALLVLAAMQTTGYSQEYYDAGGYMGGTAMGHSNTGSDQLYPYDGPEPWLHGYWQDMPFYGGYKHFRPYNYKAVLSQTQTSAGWGMNPRMPYSQQFWHRYHQQAALSPYETYGYSTGQGSVHYPNPASNQSQPQYQQPMAPVYSQPMMQQPAPQQYVPQQPYAPQPMMHQPMPLQQAPSHSLPVQPTYPTPVQPNMSTAPISYPTYTQGVPAQQLPAPVYPQYIQGYSN